MVRLTLTESRKKFGRPFSKYAESRYGGNTYYDDVCLLLNDLAQRCEYCWAPTQNKYLEKGICPDCRGLLDGSSRQEGEKYLLSRNWEHVLTEADGCDSWRFPFELRKDAWPDFIFKQHGTQHYWDFDEAIALQREVERFA